MYQARAYAMTSANSPLAPTVIQRRDLTPRDVQINVLFCGICHSDLHHIRNDFGRSHFPLIPGHEIIGRVTRVGSSASKHKVGDLVAVGCLVDSDRTCDECKAGFVKLPRFAGLVLKPYAAFSFSKQISNASGVS